MKQLKKRKMCDDCLVLFSSKEYFLLVKKFDYNCSHLSESSTFFLLNTHHQLLNPLRQLFMFSVVRFNNPPGSFSTFESEIGVKKKTIHSVQQLLITKSERIQSGAIPGLRQALGVVNLVKAERQDEHRHAHGKSLGDGVASQK